MARSAARRASMRLKHVVQPPDAGEDAPAWSVDGSIWSLLFANVIALVFGLQQGWSLASLMMVYWAQSVVIGIANVFRMLALDKFSTENFTMNDRPVQPTPATKRQVAAFFAFHYGAFHAGYLLFLVTEQSGGPLVGPGFWLCVAAFALNHAWSYRYNRDLDRQGTPNIGTLMFTPYARVIPMHITIVLGSFLMESAAGLLLFGGLKTGADLVMHVVEHQQLGKVRSANGLTDGAER